MNFKNKSMMDQYMCQKSETVDKYNKQAYLHNSNVFVKNMLVENKVPLYFQQGVTLKG